MLEVRDVSLTAGTLPDGEQLVLLKEISAFFPTGHFGAIVGPSGSGKSTLLKMIAGIREPEAGGIFWDGQDLAVEDLDPHEIGYVPQFGISFNLLTVAESMDAALRLRVGGLSDGMRQTRASEILRAAGLEDIADRRTGVLSGGQKRRLALALEMATQPVLLLCDEVTSGLDTKSENDIVKLMQRLAKDGTGRTVLSVTHSLRHLEMHDTVAVLYKGRLVYHAAPDLMSHYFSITGPEHLFDKLETRRPDSWAASWRKHREAYYACLMDSVTPVAREAEDPITSPSLAETFAKETIGAKKKPAEFSRPGWITQFLVLLTRQRRLLVRDRGHLLLQLALLFGFPCLVVIFAWDGLPQMANFSNSTMNAVQQILATASYTLQAVKVGGLVSGLVMFQVILLTLMGSNNSAREIAGQRAIFEKEKFAGLRTSAFLASKAVYVMMLLMAQSIWMALFVNTICRFPGDLFEQAATLVAVNAAMTCMCLGISAQMKTPDQASLVSVYLVGFQLPLSGAVLALPKGLEPLTRPFIAAYWGWSGYLETMRDTRFYDAVKLTSQTAFSPLATCFWVLLAHILAGLTLAYYGARESRWE